MKNQSKGALAGVRILDLSRVLGGPLAGQTLADHGADVIKVEPPQGDEARDMGSQTLRGASSVYINVNRNKRGIALDLTKPAGRAVLLRLLADTDVLIENFKVGTMEHWGLDYATLAQRFPRLIYASLTGFGKDGPLGNKPGYDVMVQAWTGLVSINGSKESGPMRMGIPVIDMAAGSNLVTGVLLALYERTNSGVGQHIDITLYDTGISITHPHSPNYFLSGKVPELMGNDYANLAPYNLYRAKGQPIFIAVGNDQQFARLCEVIGRPALSRDAKFNTNAARIAHRDELKDHLEAAFAEHEGSALCASMLDAGVPAGLVQTIPEALEHPHTTHRKMRVKLGPYQWTGIPVKLSRTPGEVRLGPPEFNQHGDEILAAAAYSPEEIAALRNAGAVGGPRGEQ